MRNAFIVLRAYVQTKDAESLHKLADKANILNALKQGRFSLKVFKKLMDQYDINHGISIRGETEKDLMNAVVDLGYAPRHHPKSKFVLFRWYVDYLNNKTKENNDE